MSNTDTDTDALVPVAFMLRNLLDPKQKPWPARVDSEAYKLAANRDDSVCEPLYGPDTIKRLIRERDEAQQVCAEAYQVVGILLDDTGQFETEHGTKILDNLSEHRPVHDDVLPWSSVGPIHPNPSPKESP